MLRHWLVALSVGFLTVSAYAQDGSGSDEEQREERRARRAQRQAEQDGGGDTAPEAGRRRGRGEGGGFGGPGFGPGFGGPGGPGFGGPGGGRMFERLADELELTEEQRPEYDAIVAGHRERMEGMRDVWGQMREAREAGDDAKVAELREQLGGREAMEESMNDTLDEIAPILDDTQQGRLTEMREEMRGRRENFEQMRRLATELPDEVGMDEAQREQFEQMLQTRREAFRERFQEMRPIFEEMREAEESGDRERVKELREQLRSNEPNFNEIREQAMEQVREILTEEQQPKLQAFYAQVTGGTAAGGAETGGKGEQSVRHVLMSASRVKLDREQRNEWNTIRRDAMKELRKIGPRDTAAQSQLAMTVRSKITDILTPEQAADYEEKLSEPAPGARSR
jgi:Spy/CpxP family protein refolding chaperone